MPNEFFNETLLITLLAAHVSVLSVFLIHKMRTLQTRLSRSESTHRQELQRLGRAVAGLVNRLQLAENELDKTAQQQVVLKANKQLETNFGQATKLLDLGLDSQQLMHSFGMSEAEANLMSLVHNRQDGIREVA